MGKYIKKFATHSQYEAYINGSDAYLPNVSTCDDQPTHVHYNPELIYRTVSGDPYCNGYDKYVDVESQVSRDNGVTWETTATTATLVERNSADCGYVDDKLVAYYWVDSTSEDTQLFNSYYGDGIDSIEIDGVVLPTVQNTYRFNTIGEHIVKFTFTDPTLINEDAFKGCGADITRFEVPACVTKMESCCLDSSHPSYNVVMRSTVPPIGESMFCTYPGNILVPTEEAKETYQQAIGWQDYSDIILVGE